MKSKTINVVRDEEHVISEANGRASREQIILAAPAANIAAGTVLGKITASGKYTPFTTGAVDGSETPAGILMHNIEALDPAADIRDGAHVRDCEVNGNKLAWPAGISDNDKATAEASLATLGILVRY